VEWSAAQISARLPTPYPTGISSWRKPPVALGFVLDPEQSGSVPSVPMLLRGPLPLHRLWRGAVGPAPLLAAAVAGIGALSLPANADGVVRRALLLVGAGEKLLPGLALETVRLLREASAYVLRSEPAMLEVGDVSLPCLPMRCCV
jgi:adenylate cyclase